jgi:hypothetical protein
MGINGIKQLSSIYMFVSITKKLLLNSSSFLEHQKNKITRHTTFMHLNKSNLLISMKSLILILFAGIYTCIAEAQAPRKIPYQAVARNNQRDPIANQNISVRFQIQDSLLNTLFQEDQQTSTNTLGLFQLQIGSITPLNIDWTGGTRFLKVSIDISGGNNYID